jgi:CRP-like cAMP-binding protein/DNA-binding NarL/FixJ family response regulator
MKTVLVVEDDEIIREDVAEILSLSNYRVYSAVNGKDGLEKTFEFKPDLIISDITMPVVDGMGMLHLLRKNPETEGIPVIFLTSRSERSDMRNAMDSGADDYIVKPFNGDELLRAVENRFKRIEVLHHRSVPNVVEFQEFKPVLEEVSAKGISGLLEDHDSNMYQKKQIIYKEGHNPFNLYYIKSGKVKTYKVHEDGKQLVVGLYTEGDYLGYIALLEGSTYNETAEALEETELVLIPRKEFEELLQQSASVQFKFIKLLANNVSETEKALVGIAYDTLRKKVAKALMQLLNKFHTNKNETFLIDLSRDDIASIAGTATESLIRAMTEFRNEQLIDIRKDNRIEIINPKKLANLLR